MDRRKAVRFTVQLRCFVTPAGARGTFLSGTCENLSRAGLLVRIPPSIDPAALPRRGDYLEVDVELPGRSEFNAGRSLHCLTTAHEIRGGQAEGFALIVQVHQMQFRDLPVRFYSALRVARQGEAVM